MFEYSFRKIEKYLRYGYISSAGRNHTGMICVHHHGGGQKRRGYKVDFFRRINSFGFLAKIQKTSFFSGWLGLVLYQNGIISYILLADKVKVGDRLYSGSVIPNQKNRQSLVLGSSLALFNIPVFTCVSNLEYFILGGGKLARAAGTSGILASKITDITFLVKFKSGWGFIFSGGNMCTIGQVSNSMHKFLSYKKAGVMRALGIRPTVRGVAMNPCDHPHGGGEGRKSPPAAARSPWGWLTKGTSSNKKKYEKERIKLFKNLR